MNARERIFGNEYMYHSLYSNFRVLLFAKSDSRANLIAKAGDWGLLLHGSVSGEQEL